jgi:hypothetical protein
VDALRIRIDPAEDSFLADHLVAGRPLLPTVMGLDLLVRAAAPGPTGCVVVSDVVVGPPVRFSGVRAVSVATSPAPAIPGRDTDQVCTLTSVESGDVHLRARVGSTAGQPAPASSVDAWGPDLPIGPELVYPPYFHGPTFQVIGGFGRSGPGFVAELAGGLPPLRWSSGPLQLRARLLELFMQACGLVALAESGRLLIPWRIAGLSWWPDARRPAPGSVEQPAIAVVTAATGTNRLTDTFDGQLVDAGGQVLLSVSGYQAIDLGLPPDLRHAATLRRLLSTPTVPITLGGF